MALSTGELSSLNGKVLMMTATATKKTIRILKDQLPEISKWTMILNPPIRKNVTILVPPVEIISPKFETILTPFIQEMILERKTFLILVRGRSAFSSLCGGGLMWWFRPVLGFTLGSS